MLERSWSGAAAWMSESVELARRQSIALVSLQHLAQPLGAPIIPLPAAVNSHLLHAAPNATLSMTLANSSLAAGGSYQWVPWLLGPLLCLLCLATVLGNGLVVSAVLTRRYLQNPTSYLIVSMACADLIVGLLVMPISILLELNHQEWALGLAFCDIWHSLDILACTASIWNLSVISLDRYFAIHSPLNYWDVITNLRVYALIAAVWLGSSLISFPAIAFWRHLSPQLYTDPTVCLMTTAPGYVVPASIIAYYIPLCIIFFAYTRIFLIASHHVSGLTAGRTKAGDGGGVEMRVHRGGAASSSNPTASPTLSTPLAANPAQPRRDTYSLLAGSRAIMAVTFSQLKAAAGSSFDSDDLHSDDDCSSIASFAFSPTSSSATHNAALPPPPPPLPGHSPLVFRYSSEASPLMPLRGLPPHSNPNSNGTRTGPPSSQVPTPPSKAAHKRRRKGLFRKFLKEQRAAKTLGIVVGCFVLCWGPFFVTNMVMTACPDCLAGADLALTFITWLGYLNSALNPLIYGCFNRQFRRAFREMICRSRRKSAQNPDGTLAAASHHLPATVRI